MNYHMNDTLVNSLSSSLNYSSCVGNQSVSDAGGTGSPVSSDASHLENNGESDGLLKEKIANPNANIYSISSHCPSDWDGVLCWPTTLMGETATLPCMDNFHGIPYNTSGSATRICEDGGIWSRTDYKSCMHMVSTLQNSTSEGTHLEITLGVYFFGYCLSLTALLCAAVIFIAFKELRCLRNTIHSHLIITYILADALWVISLINSVHSKNEKHGGRTACVSFILLHYFYLTNFFWMFVEGLYLYVLVVQTFMAENIKLRTYCVVGWGIPLFVVTLWCIIRWFTMTQGISEEINPIPDLEQNVLSCPWLHENVYDWIHKSSALLVLAANMIFLLQIMWVLITKLRSQTTPETKQSRKAAKALVVLMPLLGITYVLVLIGPRKVPTYEYVRAFLISTQGFLVALFYCFLNQEVRLALKHRWTRIRNLGPDWNCCGCEHERQQSMHQMRDWSPRSRTESIRLYTPTGSNHFRKRESSTSETTMMTAVLGSLQSSFNGSSGGVGQGGQSVIMTTAGRRISSTPLQSCRSSNLTVNEDIALV